MKNYCIKQHDITDCGAACLAAIGRLYGYKKPISQIREIAGTDKMGTNALGLVKAAEKLGFIAKGVKGENRYIATRLNKSIHTIKTHIKKYWTN